MDIGQILIGGFVTLAGTLGVQLYVVPHVQARNRGRERWETDMMSLAALLEEEMPRALDSYRWAGYTIRYLRQMELTEEVDPAKFAELRRGKDAERREADRVVGQQMASLKRLADRARRLHPRAGLWYRMDAGRMSLSLALFHFDHEHSEDPVRMTDDDWEKGWAEVRKAREQLLDMVNVVVSSHPMTPPAQARRWTLARARFGTVARLRKVAQLPRRLPIHQRGAIPPPPDV